MRKIKFRVWDKRIKIMQGSESWFLLSQNGSLMSHAPMKPVRFEPEKHYVIMQYIGLTDKNGKEIYEGHILKDRNGRIGEVIFAYGSYWFYPFEMVLISSMNVLCEIIGDVYNNPELLEEI